MSKPNGPVFDAEWRARCRIVQSNKADADWMIRSHYLRTWPAVTVLILVMTSKKTPVWVIVYALPPRETDKRYGGKTWELARLWVHDDVPKNAETYLIGQSVRFIRKHYLDVRFLVSYADPSHGHEGTIYRAANWTPDGRTDEERKTPKFDYAATDTDIFGMVTTKRFSRQSHIPGGVTVDRLYRASKFRFYYQLPEPKRAMQERVQVMADLFA